MGISPYRQFLEPKGPGLFRPARHTRAKSPSIPRLVREWKSQGPNVQKKSRTIVKGERRLEFREFRVCRIQGAEQYRNTAGIQGALHIDRGIADEPDVGSGE